MGPDHDVHGPRRQPRQDCSGLLIGAHPGELLHHDREGRQPFFEGEVVLLGEHRGGNQQRHLAAPLDRLEGRAQSDLGLAEADVSAEQPVHGPSGLHVALDVLDDQELVAGLLIGERGFQLLLPVGVTREGVALGIQPAGVELDQFLSDLVHPAPHRTPGALPLPGAQPGELGMLLGTTRVALDPIEVLDRHVELAALGVLQLHVLTLPPVVRHPAHGQEATDPVVAMDHHVSGFELEPEVGGSHPGTGGLAQPPGRTGLGPPHRPQQRGDPPPLDPKQVRVR